MKLKGQGSLTIPVLAIYFVACISVITLCYCALFNYPSGDDYGYAYRIARDGFWNSFVDTYLSWSGRYVATILSFINPLLIGGEDWLFSAYSIFMILAFVVSTFFFMYQLLYGINKCGFFLATSLIICVLFAGMPSFFECFYWFSAYISYVVPLILILMFLGLYLFCERNISQLSIFSRSSIYVILLGIVVFVNGCNELVLIAMNCIIVLLIILNKKEKLLWILLMASVVSSIAMVGAPGNFARLTECNSYINIGHVLLYGTIFTGFFIVKKLTLVVGMSIVYIVLVAPIMGEKKTQMKISPYLLIIFALFVVWLMNVFMFLSTDTKPLERTENVVFIFWVFAWAVILHRLIPNSLIKHFYTHKSRLLSSLGLVLFLCLMFNYESSMNATFADLFSGNIHQFAKERQEQIDVQKNSKSPKTIIPSLTVAPKTLTYTLYDDKLHITSVISLGEPFYGTQPIFENDTVRVQDSRVVWRQIKSNFKSKLGK